MDFEKDKKYNTENKKELSMCLDALHKLEYAGNLKAKNVCRVFDKPSFLGKKFIENITYTETQGWVFTKGFIKKFSEKYNIAKPLKEVTISKFFIVRVIDRESKSLLKTKVFPTHKEKHAYKAFLEYAEKIWKKERNTTTELYKISDFGSKDLQRIECVALENNMDIQNISLDKFNSLFDFSLLMPNIGKSWGSFIRDEDVFSQYLLENLHLAKEVSEIIIREKEKNPDFEISSRKSENLHFVLTELMVRNFKTVSGLKYSFKLSAKKNKLKFKVIF